MLKKKHEQAVYIRGILFNAGKVGLRYSYAGTVVRIWGSQGTSWLIVSQSDITYLVRNDGICFRHVSTFHVARAILRRPCKVGATGGVSTSGS